MRTRPARISTDDARQFYEPFRAAFEAGDSVESLVTATGRDRSAIYRAAKTLGWSWSQRRSTGSPAHPRKRKRHPATSACRECGQEKPGRAFKVAGRLRTICRACRKTKERRAKGRLTLEARRLAEAQARAARPVLVPTPPTAAQLRRTLRTLLGKLFLDRCASVGENAGAVEYRVRYRTNAAFREKEIARRWATKVRDANRRLCTDGTLDSRVLRQLFGAASHCCYCERAMRSDEKTLDHVIPVSRGGQHSIANVAIACRSCNVRKRARTP
jgi:5-methylcytosine-specific restriction endonuclease McrA